LLLFHIILDKFGRGTKKQIYILKFNIAFPDHISRARKKKFKEKKKKIQILFYLMNKAILKKNLRGNFTRLIRSILTTRAVQKSKVTETRIHSIY
jgi:hypothetical protein